MSGAGPQHTGRSDNEGMDFELRTITGCPNDAPAKALFSQALELEGLDPAALAVREVISDAEAAELNFHGSPTFTLDGTDLFPSPTEPAVTCRIYPTPAGLRGQPELAALRSAIRDAVRAAVSP